MYDLQLTQIAINGYHHTFSELSSLLGHSAAASGLHTAGRMVIAHDPVDVITAASVNVLFGDLAYAAPRLRDAMAGGPFVAWQLEPLAASTGLAARYPAYLDLLRKAVRVWDYNANNIALLRDWGITQAVLLPLGYHASLEKVPKRLTKDIDVCFFGCMTQRRRTVIDALQQAGLSVVAREKCYGAERDEIIGRSRISLNIHGYEDLPVLEEARVSYLLANTCFVVSEDSDCNPYGDGVVFAPYAGLVGACHHWLSRSDAERKAVAERGHAALRRLPFRESLAAAYQDARSALAG